MRSVPPPLVSAVLSAAVLAGCQSPEPPPPQSQWLYVHEVDAYLLDVGGVAPARTTAPPMPRDVRYRPVLSYTPAPYYREAHGGPSWTYRDTAGEVRIVASPRPAYVAAAPVVVTAPPAPLPPGPEVRTGLAARRTTYEAYRTAASGR